MNDNKFCQGTMTYSQQDYMLMPFLYSYNDKKNVSPGAQRQECGCHMDETGEYTCKLDEENAVIYRDN